LEKHIRASSFLVFVVKAISSFVKLILYVMLSLASNVSLQQ